MQRTDNILPFESKVIFRDGQTTRAFSKDEWFEVGQTANPSLTREEFDVQWEEMMVMKAARLRELNQ